MARLGRSQVFKPLIRPVKNLTVEPHPPRIFLSASYEDSRHPTLERFIQALMAKGVTFWRSHEILNTGSSIMENIRSGISDSDYFFFVISKRSSSSVWQGAEYEFAIAEELLALSTRIVLLSLDGFRSSGSRVPFDMRDRLMVDLSQDIQASVDLVAKMIFKTNLEQIAQFELDKADPYPSIIKVTSTVDRKLVQYFARHPKELYEVNPRRFEELIAELFSGFGYDVELTMQTRDGGRDIMAIKNDEVKIKHLIECKRYRQDRKVSVGAVRALYGVKEHYRATKAILATTAFFTKSAAMFFQDHPWELEPKDFNGIMQWIDNYLKKAP